MKKVLVFLACLGVTGWLWADGMINNPSGVAGAITAANTNSWNNAASMTNGLNNISNRVVGLEGQTQVTANAVATLAGGSNGWNAVKVIVDAWSNLWITATEMTNGNIQTSNDVDKLQADMIDASNILKSAVTYSTVTGSLHFAEGGTTIDGVNTNSLVNLKQLQDSVPASGSFWAYGATNTVDYTNIFADATFTNVVYLLRNPSTSVAFTNAVAVTGNNQYVAGYVTKLTTKQLRSGSVKMWLYAAKSAAGAVSILPELYMMDTVTNGYSEISPNSTVNAKSIATAKAQYEFILTVPDFNSTNDHTIMLRFKTSGVTASPILYFITQGFEDSHAEISLPVSTLELDPTWTAASGLVFKADNALKLDGLRLTNMPDYVGLSVVDPTNDIPLWAPFTYPSGVIVKLRTQSIGFTGQVDTLRKYWTNGMGNYETIWTNTDIQEKGADVAVSGNYDTNYEYGFRIHDLSAFISTNKLQVLLYGSSR